MARRRSTPGDRTAAKPKGEYSLYAPSGKKLLSNVSREEAVGKLNELKRQAGPGEAPTLTRKGQEGKEPGG